jgi:hypothetical protein
VEAVEVGVQASGMQQQLQLNAADALKGMQAAAEELQHAHLQCILCVCQQGSCALSTV